MMFDPTAPLGGTAFITDHRTTGAERWDGDTWSHSYAVGTIGEGNSILHGMQNAQDFVVEFSAILLVNLWTIPLFALAVYMMRRAAR